MILVYKNLGETPLECLERVRLEQNIEKLIPMTYAGRLDPMAEGLMVLLVGEECKEKDKWTCLDKVYEFEILVGFTTDTYDLLGLVKETSTEFLESISSPRVGSPDIEINPKNSAQKIHNVLNIFIGTQTQSYPAFSSKTVDGVQIFNLAKSDTLPDVLPSHTINIYSLDYIDTRIISKNDLQDTLHFRINKVHGDFRQEQILEKWDSVLASLNETEFTIIKCVATVSSGTYIRQLVQDIGVKLDIPMVTFSIKRVKIGEREV